MSMNRTIHTAFLPLLDAAPLIVAADKGFAEAENIDLRLVRETSWANVRDRLSVGHFEVAHLLAPLPVAAALGLSPNDPSVIAPMALGLGGNTVTISSRLAARIKRLTHFSGVDAAAAGTALKTALRGWEKDTGSRPVFAVVHRFSSHNLDLRYWLSASGIEPDDEVDIVIVSPSLMPSMLVEGKIDGFCVGEPWGSAAVAAGAGHILTSKASIWRSSPEKVLGVNSELLEREPEVVHGLIRSVYRAAQWCSDRANGEELVSLLQAPHRLNIPMERLYPAMSGKFHDLNGAPALIEDFYIPFEKAANFPWQSHALWFYTQMVRWGLAKWDAALVEKVEGAYRPDVYRAALASLNLDLPAASSKVEGALMQPENLAS
ncbi:MAG: CmpA/NrtA family ABC transporter substrate-binding protein, partial [Pseudomonadota bacterium]